MSEKFFDRLCKRSKKVKSWVCVGLDVDPEKLPDPLRGTENGQETFGLDIIEETHELTLCYKINSAFFEAEGINGYTALVELVEAARDYDVPVILDAKRADIGNTSRQYAKACFEDIEADAVTVNPYLGRDAIEPFLEYEDKGVIVLGLTSNPGAQDFLFLQCDEAPLYEHVARKVDSWNTRGNCGLVVGATQPEAFQSLRGIAPNLPFLVPGVGAQGGAIDAVISSGQTESGVPPMINSSRGILYASSGDDYALKAKAATKKLRDSINKLRGI